MRGKALGIAVLLLAVFLVLYIVFWAGGSEAELDDDLDPAVFGDL